MSVPESSLVAAVERISRALEQLASAPPVRAVLEEVARSAAGTLAAELGLACWREEDGTLRACATAALPDGAAAACAALLLRQPAGTPEEPLPYLAEDLRTDALLAAEPGLRERLGATALVALPLFLADGTRVGVLVDVFRAPRRVTEEELRRFGLYAKVARIALERDRTLEGSRRIAAQARAEAEQAEVLRLSRFQAVTEGFSRALTRRDVARVVLELGLPAVEAVAGMVHMVAPHGEDVELVAAVGVGPEVEAELQRLPLRGALPGYDAARTRAPVWLESSEELRERYPELAALPGVAAYQAFAFLPLLAEGRVAGVIAFGFGAPRRFSASERASILGLARQCGLALERALLYERERAARLQAEAAGRRLKLLADASALLSRSLEWEETVAGVARLALGSFADWCAVDALEGGTVRRLAVLHADPTKAQLAAELMAYPPELAGGPCISETLLAGQPRMESRLMPEPESRCAGDARLLALTEGLGVRSYIIAPLIARQRALGALSFVRGPHMPLYAEEDLALAEELARRAALAMDNARLFRERSAAEESARHSAARLHLLARVSQLVAEAGLDLAQVLDVLAREVAESIGDGCVLQLVSEEGSWLEPAAVHHPEDTSRVMLGQAVRARRLRVGEGLQGAAVSTGQTILLPALSAEALDGSDPEAALRSYLERQGPQSVIVVALVAHGRARGSLLVLRPARGQPYGHEDQVLLESLASRAALAIEDARLYADALQALRQRDDFLSVAGHELKNPLNALQLQLHVLARLAREPRSQEGLAERVERVARTGEKLGVLIDDLLDVSRISTGQLQLVRTELDLVALVHEAASRMTEELSRASCDLRVEGAPSVPGCWDRLRLEQVVVNLLSNACKYGRDHPVRVRVEAHERVARLSVQDGGVGIAPEDQARIFQRFQRAERTRHIQGLGLGLWICRQIVEAHGGTLRVESTPGQGATFIMELPLQAPTPSA
jgi:signal transduction histidine kinase